MSFFTNIRADRFILELKEATDVAAPKTQKAIEKLRELGPGAIEPVTAALADADKIATVAYIEVLTGLVNQKTFPKFIEAMVTGSPRVVAGVAWALSSSRAYPPTMLLEALNTDGIAKSALDRKSTRLNSSHLGISYAVFCLKKKKKYKYTHMK